MVLHSSNNPVAADADSLPTLWDCDFLLGPKQADGQDTYVLCEINVCSVAPDPESAVRSLTGIQRTGGARKS